MKRCPRCEIEKPHSDFPRSKQTPDGLYGICKDCRNTRRRERYADDADTYREDVRWRMLKHNYGITREDWTRMFEAQKGLCGICHKRLTDKISTRSQLRKADTACIDHDHESGIVRGILCHDCNLGIGNLKHDVSLLRAAIEYLG